MTLSHLFSLETSDRNMREVVAEAHNPVMLYSIGKDSSAMLHIAKRHFIHRHRRFHYCTLIPWKFREMYELRDRGSQRCGLIIHQNPEAIERGINLSNTEHFTDMWKTAGLKQALDKFEFDAARGARRDGVEKNRGRKREFSHSAMRSTAGTQKYNGQNCGRFLMLGRTTREHACFHFQIGPNWTFGNTFTTRA